MSGESSDNTEKTIQETVTSGVIAFLLGFGISFIYEFSGVSFPSINQVTSQLWVAAQVWTDIASIRSPKSYAINAIVIVTVISAVLNSWNRDSPSPTITGILTSPGVAVWSKFVNFLINTPFLGTLIHGLGGAMRLYLWIGSMLLYLYYSVTYVFNSDSSLFVVTVSVILASITFGAVLGRFEKGLFLSIESAFEMLENQDFREQSNLTILYWVLMLPVSLSSAIYMMKLSIASLENPASGELISVSTSVFLTTFLAVIVLFYLIFGIKSLLSACFRRISSYRDEEWNFQEEAQERWTEYIKEEFSKSNTQDKRYGYPQEVADTLREGKE